MTNVIQFTSIPDFVADLAAGEVGVIYHDLIDQRISYIPKLGISRWLLTAVFRAIVANGRVTHVATLTYPLGPVIERMGDRIIVPNDEESNEARWQAARKSYELLIEALRDASRGLYNAPMIAGILHVPDNVPMIFAQEPAHIAVAEFLAATEEVTVAPV